VSIPESLTAPRSERFRQNAVQIRQKGRFFCVKLWFNETLQRNPEHLTDKNEQPFEE
jgi:hypothetical protein